MKDKTANKHNCEKNIIKTIFSFSICKVCLKTFKEIENERRG